MTPVSKLASAWEAAPAVLAGAALASALFLQGFVRLRRRGRTDLAGWSRAVLFFLGLAVLVLALVSPLDAIGEEYLFSAHMLQHVLVGDVAPALMLLALRGPLLFFLLPAAALVAVAHCRPVRATVSFLVRPWVTVLVWATVTAVWHVPAIYDYTLTHQTTHDLEHMLFLVSGLLVWYQLVDPARRGALTRSGRVALAIGIFAGGQILSMVLFLSLDPLYPTYAAQFERLLGLTPLTDQRLAGVVMMFEQALTLGTCAAILLLSDDREHSGLPQPSTLTPGRHG